MQIPLLLDRSRPESLTGQLVEQLREAIRRGRIPAATRLPSSRDLSEQLAISRNTVVRICSTESAPARRIFNTTGRCRRVSSAK